MWGIMLADGMMVPDSWESKTEAVVALGEIVNAGYEGAIVVEFVDYEWEGVK